MSLAAVLAAGLLACPGPAVPRRSAQLVTVQPTARTIAAVRLWQRSGRCWRLAGGPWRARLGAGGVSLRKREGDGTTPAGTYRIGATVYGIAPDPGVRGSYHRLVCGDWWDEDPRSAAYNRFVHVACGARPAFGGGSEALWRISPQYRWFAVVEYNAHPVVAGRGSAIFLHVSTGRPTAGCVSLPQRQLLRLLRWLRPAERPLVRIGNS